MKSIFTRPLFINPQAYLTIPELSYIQMATPFDFTEDSYSFVINTSGRIEGKLLKTSNDYILHLDLYSIDGNCVLGEFYLNNSKLNTDNFNLTQSKNIITLQFGEQSSGNIIYPGLIAAWSAKGKTNDDADRAILKDLTGNGHDITLNNFAYSGMNGYGGFDYPVKSRHILYPKQSTTYGIIMIKNDIPANTLLPNFDIQVSGFTNGKLYVSYPRGKYKKYLTNGLNHITDIPIASTVGAIFIDMVDVTDFNQEIIVEFIPKYPDALIFDGVDDYGSAVDFEGKEIRTVISKYQTLSVSPNRFSLYFRDPADGNIFQRIKTTKIQSKPSIRAYSDNVTLLDDYCIIERNKLARTKPFQITGYNRTREIENIAFYSAYLFDRSLDEQEIKAFIRKYIDPEYLLSSEIPTPDCYYDFSQGSNDDENRETIKDYSGNGNDAKAYNFDWGGMSGYGGYNINFLTFGNTSSNLKEKTSTKIIVNGRVNGYICYKHPKTEVPSFKIKISGLVTDYAYVDENNIRQVIRIKEGEHILPKSYASDTITTICGFMNPITSKSTENGIIELIPEYPDALVFDGVDDYISLDAFDSGLKTVFCLLNITKEGMVYDGKKPYIFNVGLNIKLYHNKTPYEGVINDVIYINGTINNNSLTSKDLINKKHCVVKVNTDEEQILSPHSPKLGGPTTDGYMGFASVSHIYKFLGFKEALTEEQIQAIIKKYNLLDGVDNIN